MQVNIYYLYGCILGDGCISPNRYRKDGSVYWQISIVVKEGKMQEDVMSILNSVSTMGCSYHRSSHSKGDGREIYGTVSCYDQDLCLKLKELLGQKENKKLPGVTCKEDAMQLLSGLIDTDGTCRMHNIRFQNTNEDIVDGVISLCEEYGIQTSKTGYKPKQENRKYCWTVTFFSRSLWKTDFDLRIGYKRDIYLKTKKCDWFERVDSDWAVLHEEAIRNVCGRGKYHHILEGRDTTISRDKYELVMNYDEHRNGL